ncbi:DNA topoisomerase (ATP-hydrolyzing) subunit A [Ruminococcus sp.]|uniref:DNA gyrase/topoisomerase IV subunit A n=1 Tax=Ruminococcus sp. TaxID=41978 RepID=UPI0025909B89|nr:DNA topoisomerase (ATP-hydrolyzing) subunit A [Ruminococcus sp.]MCR5021486.1 topoisomerase IV [Ruminococcus sp.]
MPRKKAETAVIDRTGYDEHTRDIVVSEVLTENYMPYAMSVIKSRALPEIDGFKPAHRKLLYTMYQMKLFDKKTKCANIVGQTMQYNPHGDSSIYETLVRLTEDNESLLTPLISSKGNFGKHYSRDMAYAAYRYTEAGFTKIAAELFEGINKNAVDMADNFDATKKEPVLLPTSFPNILAMPTLGIAVGMASNIASFNLKELCEATIEYIKDPKTDILDIMPGPDFSTGGDILFDRDEMDKIYRTGKGSIVVRSKYTVDKKNRRIEIREIPYSTTTEAIIENVISLCKSKRIMEIDDIRDDTDKNGLLITIEYKRSADPDEIMNKLYSLTPLQDTFSCNFTMLINNNPVVLGVYGILDEWIKFRTECIKRELTYDLEIFRKKLHLMEGLQKILLNIDKAIKIIRGTKLDKDVIPNLMKGFDIDKTQAEYITEIRLRNINEEWILDRTKEIEKIKEDIKKNETIISSDKALKKQIIKKLKEIANKEDYIKPRKTTINTEVKVEKVTVIEEVKNYDVKIIISEHGYVKKVPTSTYKEDTEYKLKDDDRILKVIDAQNIGEVLTFTDKGVVYKTKISDIEVCKAGEFGTFIRSAAEIPDDEKTVFITATGDFSGNMIVVFENGKVAKFPLNVYETKQNRKKLINAFYTNVKPVAFYHVLEDVNIKMKSDGGKLLIFNSEMINLKNSKTTQGTQVMKLPKETKILKSRIIEELDKKSSKIVVKSIPASGFSRKK